MSKTKRQRIEELTELAKEIYLDAEENIGENYTTLDALKKTMVLFVSSDIYWTLLHAENHNFTHVDLDTVENLLNLAKDNFEYCGG